MIIEVLPTLNTVEVYSNPVAAPLLLKMEAKSQGFDAYIQNAYVVDTSSTSVDAVLPALPKKGDTVEFVCLGANSLNILRNSHNINKEASDLTIVSGESALLRYLDSTFGWVRFR